MSSPHAAGVAALVKEMHPKWGPAAVKAAVQRSAQHLDCPPDWEPLNDHQNPVREIETRRYEMSVDLIRIDLRDADLSEADLNGAHLSKATLTRVKVTDEELAQAHHRFVLAQQLDHIDFLDEKIETISLRIEQQLESMSWPDEPAEPEASEGTEEGPPITDESELSLTWNAAVALLDTIPGVNRRIAEVMLAEMGLDMSQFPTADHLASWAGLAPGNHQSGGKRYSGRTTKGSKPLASIMVQAAWPAVRTKNTFLKSRFHRLAARRGKKRAIVAVAHSMLVSAWHMLANQQPYQELGGDYFDQRKKETQVSYLVRRLEKLTGGSVSIELQPAAA